jgi:hypothetical protein
MWHPGRTSKGCIIRLDPGLDGHYTRHQEDCLAPLVSRHVGVPIPFVLGAYSLFMPLTDPSTGEMLHIIGLESFIPISAGRGLTARNQYKDVGGFYSGAMYALRDSKGHWRVGEVNGRFQTGNPELVSTYTYALSPFGGQDATSIYFGGYDCNDFPSTDTAWVYRADINTVLAGEAP